MIDKSKVMPADGQRAETVELKTIGGSAMIRRLGGGEYLDLIRDAGGVDAQGKRIAPTEGQIATALIAACVMLDDGITPAFSLDEARRIKPFAVLELGEAINQVNGMGGEGGDASKKSSSPEPGSASDSPIGSAGA